MEIKTLLKGGINWDWYLQGEFNDEDLTVRILFYDRWHRHDQLVHPKHTTVGYWKLVENDKREAIAIRIDMTEVTDFGATGVSKQYRVTNPGHIFNYNDFSKMEMER